MIQINFLPWRKKEHSRAKVKKCCVIGALVLIGCLLSILIIGYIRFLITAQNNKNQIFQTRLTQLNTQEMHYQALRTEYHSLLKQKKLLDELKVQHHQVIKLLKTLLTLCRKDIPLTRIHFNRQEILIAVETARLEMAHLITKKLNALRILSEPQIEINTATQEEYEHSKLTIRGRWKKALYEHVD